MDGLKSSSEDWVFSAGFRVCRGSVYAIFYLFHSCKWHGSKQKCSKHIIGVHVYKYSKYSTSIQREPNYPVYIGHYFSLRQCMNLVPRWDFGLVFLKLGHSNHEITVKHMSDSLSVHHLSISKKIGAQVGRAPTCTRCPHLNPLERKVDSQFNHLKWEFLLRLSSHVFTMCGWIFLWCSILQKTPNSFF